MPKVPESAAFDVTSKLQKQLNFNLTAGKGDPLDGTGASIPSSIVVQKVVQNSNGTWTQSITDTESPIKSQNDLLSSFEKDRESVIGSYEEMAKVYDEEILDYNTQINQKKIQIVSTLNTALGAGCSAIYREDPYAPKEGTSGGRSFSFNIKPVVEPLIINKVSCGMGLTVYADQVNVEVYKNVEIYTATSPFNRQVETLTESNLGKGVENITSNNSGSNLGKYRADLTGRKNRVVYGGLNQTLSQEDNVDCLSYRNKILSLATEIADLRIKRDQYLGEVNSIKELKTGQEIIRWGNKKGDNGLETFNESIKSSITSLTQFTGDIVTDGIIVHFNTTETYAIKSEINSQTGVNAVVSWYNLGGDSLNADPNTSQYDINYDAFDGPSVVLNNYDTETNQYFEVADSYLGSGKIGVGNTSYTIEVWTKITKDTNLGISSTSNGATIVGINSTRGYGLQVYKPSGIRVSFGQRENGSLVNKTDLKLDTWYHIVATNEAGVGSKIYLNGSLDGTGNPINITSSVDPLRFGYSPAQISQYFSGKISIIRIYKKNLTEDEIKKNYNAAKERFGYT